MKQPRVSVLMAVYNEEEFIEKAITSVLNQTFTDLELIIVDDASTDDTSEIIERLKDERTTVLRNEKNLGKAICLNRALEVARGEFLFEVDGDDWLDHDALQNLMKAVDELPESVGLVFGGLREHRERRRSTEFRRVRPAPDYTDRNSLLLGSYKFGCRLWRKEAVEKAGGWKIDEFAQGRAFENWVLAAEVSKDYDIFPLDISVYNYRRHRRNMADRLKQHWLDVRNWVLRDSLQQAKAAPAEDEAVEEADAGTEEDEQTAAESAPAAAESEAGSEDEDGVTKEEGGTEEGQAKDEETVEDEETAEDEISEDSYSWPRRVQKSRPVSFLAGSSGTSGNWQPADQPGPRQQPEPFRMPAPGMRNQREGQRVKPVELSKDSSLASALLQITFWQSPASLGPETAVAFVPAGVLQFGQIRLPMASSVLRSLAYASKAARQLKGVIFPPMVLGMEAPQKNWGFSRPVSVDQKLVRAQVGQALNQVAKLGIPRAVFIVTPPDRRLLEEVGQGVREATGRYRGRTWVFNEQEVIRRLGYRSAAGEWEASVLLALGDELLFAADKEEEPGTIWQAEAEPSKEKGENILAEVSKYLVSRISGMRMS